MHKPVFPRGFVLLLLGVGSTCKKMKNFTQQPKDCTPLVVTDLCHAADRDIKREEYNLAATKIQTNDFDEGIRRNIFLIARMNIASRNALASCLTAAQVWSASNQMHKNGQIFDSSPQFPDIITKLLKKIDCVSARTIQIHVL